MLTEIARTALVEEAFTTINLRLLPGGDIVQAVKIKGMTHDKLPLHALN